MENLKSVVAVLLERTRSYVIVGAACFTVGLLIGALL